MYLAYFRWWPFWWFVVGICCLLFFLGRVLTRVWFLVGLCWGVCLRMFRCVVKWSAGRFGVTLCALSDAGVTWLWVVTVIEVLLILIRCLDVICGDWF